MDKKASPSKKTWEKTSVQGVYRHRSGMLYARTYCGGKEAWETLGTTLVEIARARMNEKREELKSKAKLKAAASEGRMTVGDALALFEEKVKAGWTLRGKGRQRKRKENQPSSVHYRLQTIHALRKSWPELPKIDVRKLTEESCEKWASEYSKCVSSSRFNSTLDTLRWSLQEAVEAKARLDNPAARIARCAPKQKQLSLPSSEQFREFVKAIQDAGAWCSRDVADFVQFLTFTGARKNEAAHVEWRDIDFVGGTIHLRITKNQKPRRIPMIQEARTLLEKIRVRCENEELNEPVLKVKESQKAMDSAAKKVGMVRITHHDLRHFFATVAIESGVDIPTVSRWLGHQDGGVLAMKTYGHLRDEHSRASAKKVSFEPKSDEAENKIVAFQSSMNSVSTS